MTIGTVACFAGKIGSGKTSVTRALAQCLGWRRVGFGDYVRAELTRRGGNPEVREELQNLGQQLVDSDPVSLCRAVLDAGDFSPGEDLLVDGIRHAAVYRALVEIVKPSQTGLIYLGATDDVRSLRAVQRGDAIAAATDHRVEAELETTLPVIADAVVEAGGSFTRVLSDCLDVFGRFGVNETLVVSAKKHAKKCALD